MQRFRFLVVGLCLTALCGLAQAQTVTTQFVYVKTSTSGPDVYDVYLRLLDPSNLSEGLASYTIRARYDFLPANASLNDAASWSSNNLHAITNLGANTTQGTHAGDVDDTVAGFWRPLTGSETHADVDRPAAAPIDDLTNSHYDFELVNSQSDSVAPVVGVGETAVNVAAVTGPSIHLTAVPYLGTLTVPAAAAGSRTITQDVNLFANGGSAHAGTTGDPRVFVSVGNLAITTVYTVRGDANFDGKVDSTDVSILSGGFGVGTTLLQGDFNHDGVVNSTDVSILSGTFGYGTGSPTGSFEDALVATGLDLKLAAVPEPASLALLMLGGLGLFRRERHLKYS